MLFINYLFHITTARRARNSPLFPYTTLFRSRIVPDTARPGVDQNILSVGRGYQRRITLPDVKKYDRHHVPVEWLYPHIHGRDAQGEGRQPPPETRAMYECQHQNEPDNDELCRDVTHVGLDKRVMSVSAPCAGHAE